MKGSYILLINLNKEKNIHTGKLGNLHFKSGYYVYIGSALNGINQRVNHHLSKDKKNHWHIDYLLNESEILNVYYKENNQKEECNIASEFLKKFDNIPGFGCSDCNCNSHLIYGDKEQILELIDALEFKKLT